MIPVLDTLFKNERVVQNMQILLGVLTDLWNSAIPLLFCLLYYLAPRTIFEAFLDASLIGYAAIFIILLGWRFVQAFVFGLSWATIWSPKLRLYTLFKRFCRSMEVNNMCDKIMCERCQKKE